MPKKKVSGLFSVLLLSGMLTLAFSVQPVKASYPINSMMTVSESKESQVTVSFSTPQATKVGHYDWLKIENCSYFTKPRQPMLPVRSVVVKLPKRSIVTNVRAKVEEVLLKGSLSILPVSSPTTVGSQTPGNISEDPTIYKSKSLFPKEWYVYRESHGMDAETSTRVKYLILNLFPLRFLPAENKVICAKKISVTITYNELPEILTPLTGLRNLIVTSPTLEAYALELAEWKNNTGISSRVLSTTWIYDHYSGVDNQEKIRNCIKDFVATYGIIYVTIFGDADQVPVRYVYVPDGHDTYTATDLYYADLDGTWDDNSDGLYADQGNDTVDGIPDVYVGRIPPSLAEYAQAAVDKIKEYQQQFDPSQNWTKRIVLAAGTGHNGEKDTHGNASTVLNEYIANIASDKDIVKLYESAGNLSTTSMASAINNGALFVNFAGHGDPGSTPIFSAGWLFYWVVPPLWWNGFGISDVLLLTNGLKLPVVTAKACSTARFDDTDCIGEAFVLAPDGGSIAYFGATRVSYSWANESAPYGLAGEMDRRIYENFYEGVTRLGQMWGETVGEYVQDHIWNYQYASKYDVKTFLEFVLLGDPTLRIYNGPETLKVPEEYTTIQGAINSAYDGDIIFVEEGTYCEHVVINKSVAIIGEKGSTITIDGNGTGTVITIVRDYVNITGFTVRNSGYPLSGIVLSGVSYCNISENNITANIEVGIILTSSLNNTIQRNNIAGNSEDGMRLYNSSGNSISRNNMTANSKEGVVLCRSSNYNTISGNNITNNGRGINLCNCSNNSIYHNNFVNNTQQTHITMWSYTNALDNGYPSGGNYWSDYNGTDVFRGPYQNETGRDGIGDTPYFIDADNQDNYPLMEPYGSYGVQNCTVLVKTLTIHDDPLPSAHIIFKAYQIEGYTNSSGQASFQIPEGQYTVQMEYATWMGLSNIGYYMVKTNVTVSSDMTIIFDPKEHTKKLQISALDIEGEPINNSFVTLTSLTKPLPHSHPLGLTDDSGNLTCYVTLSQYHVVLRGSTYLLWERYVNACINVDVRFKPTLEAVGASNLTADSTGVPGVSPEECSITYYFDLYESNDTFGGWVHSFCISNPELHGFESKIVYIQSGYYETGLRIELHTHPIDGYWLGHYWLEFVYPPFVAEYSPTVFIHGEGILNITWGGPLEMTFYADSSEYSKGDSARLYLNITDSYEHRLERLDWWLKYGNLTIKDPMGNVIIDKIGFLNAPREDLINPYVFKIHDVAEYGTYDCSVEVYASGLEFYGGKLTGNCSFVVRAKHDIAVTNVVLSKTVVCQGYSMKINVTVENQGDVTETFNVTVYWNSTHEIDTEEITLASGSNTTITFYWNTTGFAEYQNYTISAYAHPVPGETDTDDNTFIDGMILLVHVGDVNVDGKVRVDDILAVALKFGSNLGDPNWDPLTDINCDDKVRVDDILAAALEFGWTKP